MAINVCKRCSTSPSPLYNAFRAHWSRGEACAWEEVVKEEEEEEETEEGRKEPDCVGGMDRGKMVDDGLEDNRETPRETPFVLFFSWPSVVAARCRCWYVHMALVLRD